MGAMRPLPVTPRPSGRSRTRYVVLAGAVALAGLAGYVGYVVYPRFDLPSVTGAGLLLLAAGAGVASFFSPCSFPLLLTLLAREVGGEPPSRRLRSALVFAGAFSVGAVAFVLVLLGLIQAEVVPVSFHVLERVAQPLLQRQAGFRRRHPVAGFAAFGFAYLIIGFG